MDSSEANGRRLIDYYSALELLLSDSTRRGFDEYRTHFGPAQKLPPSDYCWLATSVDPNNHRAGADFMTAAFQALEEGLAADLERPPLHVLDVGCGAGGTMRSWLERWPHCTVTGINVNAQQLASARRMLAPYGDRAHLIHASFLDTALPEAHFDFVCFVESAFHMSDKDALFAHVAPALTPGGRVRFVDIFSSARAAALAKRNDGVVGGTRDRDRIFFYSTREAWLQSAQKRGLHHEQWLECGKQVARFLHIASSWEQMQKRYVEPRLGKHPHRVEFTQSLYHLYVGYKRLGRSLRAGALEYGVLGFRR